MLSSKIDGTTYTVTIEDRVSTSSHTVTFEPDYVTKLLVGDETIESLLRRSFEFLLERESKESILSSFNLRVISRYFPEYEREITN